MSESFGEKIRARRKELGFTLEQLAEKLDTTKNYVWQLENKKPARPSGKLLLRLADLLETSPDFLIDDNAATPTAEHLKSALFRSEEFKTASEADIEKVKQILAIVKKKQ